MSTNTRAEFTRVHVEKNVVCVAVVASSLVLSGNEYGSPRCLRELLQSHVHLEQVLGVLQCI